MARPRIPRTVATRPIALLFKPGGGPARSQIRLSLDELEALRLADLEALMQEEAASRMGVSRPTFGRILGAARRKVSEAIVLGRALRIEGGAVSPAAPARGRCPFCAHRGGPTTPDHCARCGQELVQLKRRRAGA